MQNKLFFLLVLFSFCSFSQNYDYVDSKVKNYSNIENIESLSEKIKSDFDTNEEKIRALFVWLVENIKYQPRTKSWGKTNLKFYFSDYHKKRANKKREEALAENAIKRRKTNCYGYSLIFNSVCNLLNIESHIIFGYAKGDLFDIGEKNILKNHAWNSVKVNDQWQLIDISWTVGYRAIEQKSNNAYYYFITPNEFINQHFPANPKWQLLPKKISKKEFISTPILYPKYYSSAYKLTNEKKGIIKVSKQNKNIIINFNQILKNHKMSYVFIEDYYSKPLFFKKNKDGTRSLKIKFSKKRNSFLTIFSNTIPLIGYKVEFIN